MVRCVYIYCMHVSESFKKKRGEGNQSKENSEVNIQKEKGIYIGVSFKYRDMFMYVCMYVCMYMHVCIYMYVCICMYMYVCVCVYILSIKCNIHMYEVCEMC